MIEEILKRFALLSGVNGEQLSSWSVLCGDALCFVREHVTKEKLTKEEENSICTLAAAFAYYKFCLAGADDISSFTAGDVHISRESELKKAEKMWKTEVACSAGLTDLDGFYFSGVQS